MAFLGAYKKKSTLKAAIQQTTNARESEGAKADQLYISAYKGFADVVKDDLVMGEALYNWGFALLHQAQSKGEDESIKIYLEAISKFTFCLLVTPNHLGAAIDGGVAYMDLSRILEVDPTDELYDLAEEFFVNAGRIQSGSAAYNLACIYAIKKDKKLCLELLELAKDKGSLPSAENIIDDVDMVNVKNEPWFTDFMDKVTAVPEPEKADNTAPVYDAEGNVTNKRKKKSGYENEVDGVVYDAEGNVLRGGPEDEAESIEAKPEASDVAIDEKAASEESNKTE